MYVTQKGHRKEQQCVILSELLQVCPETNPPQTQVQMNRDSFNAAFTGHVDLMKIRAQTPSVMWFAYSFCEINEMSGALREFRVTQELQLTLHLK